MHSMTSSSEILWTHVRQLEAILNEPFYQNEIDQSIKVISKNISKTISTKGDENSVTELQKLLKNFYRTLSTTSVLHDPLLAGIQNDLALSLLNAEKIRYSLQIEIKDGGKRFFSQIAFLNFLIDKEGQNLINYLSSFMDGLVKKVFNDAITNITNHLGTDYVELLSIIDARKALNFSFEDFEKDISKFLQKLENRTNILIPLGWAASDNQLGHHLFLLIEKIKKTVQ